MRKPLFGRTIIIVLLILFALIAAAGIYLIIISVYSPATSQATEKNSKSDIEVTVKEKEIKFKLSTGIPGIIVFVFGGVGLLLLAVRIPVRQVLGYPTPPPGAFGDALQFMTPILSKNIERIPVLLWWFIRKKGLAVRD